MSFGGLHFRGFYCVIFIAVYGRRRHRRALTFRDLKKSCTYVNFNPPFSSNYLLHLLLRLRAC